MVRYPDDAAGKVGPMPRQAAFVRNVMIGREGLHRQVLLDVVERAGGRAPRSYISTGNVTFDA